MSRGRAALALVLAGLALAELGACDSLTPNTCDTSAAAGVLVTVTQGIGGPILCDAEVTLSDGTNTEKLSAQGSPCSYGGAYEKTGTYTVVASKSGMKSMTKTGIVVDKGECHVNTQQIKLALEF